MPRSVRATTRPLAAALVVLLALVLAACSSAPAEPGPGGDPSQGGTRVVTTEQGEVEIPAEPQKVVVLNSALTGYLFVLDVPVHGSVPLNPQAEGWPELWADRAEAAGTMRVPWSNDGFDFEALLAEQPDLIIGGGQGFPGKQAQDAYAELSEIAPTVLVSTSLQTWQEELAFLAQDVFDVPDREQELLSQYETRLDEVSAAIELPPTPVNYLLMLADGRAWSIPETAALAQTLGEVGLEPAPIKAENPDIELYGSGDSFEMSTEQVGALITSPTVFVLGFQADVTSVEELSQNPTYAGLPAFTDGQAYDLPFWAHRADYLGTMALLDEVERMFG